MPVLESFQMLLDDGCDRQGEGGKRDALVRFPMYGKAEFLMPNDGSEEWERTIVECQMMVWGAVD